MAIEYTTQSFVKSVKNKMKSTGMSHKKAYVSVLKTWQDNSNRKNNIDARNSKIQSKQREQAMKIGPKMRAGSTKTLARSTYGGKTVVQKVNDTRFNIYQPYFNEFTNKKEMRLEQYKKSDGSWQKNTNVLRNHSSGMQSFESVKGTMYSGSSRKSRASVGGRGG